jgi:predicted nucleic acid-binding protein
MSQIVVDTDVASYLFNWHSLAQKYATALNGSELVLSFMSVAELRMGAISAGWGARRRLLLEQFMRGFDLFYADNDLCTVWARVRADARGRPTHESAGCLDRRDGIGARCSTRDE